MKCTYFPLTHQEKLDEQARQFPWPVCQYCNKQHIPWERRIQILLCKDDTFREITQKSKSDRGNRISIEIATIMQNLRKRLGFTVANMAKIIDKSPEYWLAMEYYGYRPSIEVMQDIENKLGVPVAVTEKFWRGARGKDKPAFTESDME